MGDALETPAPPPPEDSSSPPPPPSEESGSESPPDDDYSPPEQGSDAPGMAPSPSHHQHKHKHHGHKSDASIISGVIFGGILILAVVVIYIMCVRRKKKQQYDPDRKELPIKVDTKSQLAPVNWNQTPPGDHFGKVNPPHGGGWVAPSPPPMAQPGGEWNAPSPPPMSQPGGGYVAPPPQPMAQSSNEQSAPLSGQYPQQTSSLFSTKCQFKYDELAAATNGFSNDNLLGQGSAGIVHKGVLSDGREVAIKTLKAGSGQSDRDFLAEVDTINRVHHRHLVPLIGCCISGDKRLLVYELVPNKTLEFHLHGKSEQVMDWATRTRIAMGFAKGLAYLHEDCEPKITHRNIKAANILLDNKFEAVVSDFGLAKLTTDNYTHVSTRIMGTFGYLAPEYAASGKLTEKSDVFSYGIILLELITGRRAVDPKNKAMDDNLVDWARPLLSKALDTGDYSILVDPRLEDSYVPEEMSRMVACAAAAIRHSARRRPRMSQIVRTLDGASSVDDLNEDVKSNQTSDPKKPEQSPASYSPVMYDTRQFNADMMKYKNTP